MSFTLLFFFHDATRDEFHTLSLHDAVPISRSPDRKGTTSGVPEPGGVVNTSEASIASIPGGSCSWLRHQSRTRPQSLMAEDRCDRRSEEHTSELQSRGHLVCRLLLEKKKNTHHDARHQNRSHTR